MAWVPQAAVVWALAYGAVRVWWAIGDAPSFPPLGTDLIGFTGWRAVALCAAAAAVALALRTAPWRWPLFVAACGVSAASNSTSSARVASASRRCRTWPDACAGSMAGRTDPTPRDLHVDPDPQLDRVCRAFDSALRRMCAASTEADVEGELSNLLCHLYRLNELGKGRLIKEFGEKLGKQKFHTSLLGSDDLRTARAAIWARSFDAHDVVVVAPLGAGTRTTSTSWPIDRSWTPSAEPSMPWRGSCNRGLPSGLSCEVWPHPRP
jgi:hypothetical protein